MSKLSTKERFIRVSVTLFQQRGYYATGTQEILEKAKAPRGSMYHHFPGGKAELARSCVRWVTDEVVNEIRRLRLEGKSPSDVITSLALGTAKWLQQTNWEEGPLLPTLLHEFSVDDADMMDEVRGGYSRIIAEFTQMFVVDGLEEAEAAKHARKVVAMLDGATTLARALKEPDILRLLSS